MDKIAVGLRDGYDGESAAVQTVRFGLDGVTYEIDLSAENAQKLRDELQMWVNAGRRVGGLRRRRSAKNDALQSTDCEHRHFQHGPPRQPSDGGPAS